MKRCFLALAVLMSGAVGMASADYILIKVNVGQQKEPAAQGAGAIGMIPGSGMIGSPMPGGLTPGRPPGGAAGMTPRRPPGGAVGGGSPFPGQMGGSSPFPGQMGGGYPGANQMGGGYPGSSGGYGFLGQQGGAAGAQADAPIEIIAVAEVDAVYLKLDNDLRGGIPLNVRSHWGITKLWNLPGGPEVRVYAINEPSVAKRYAAEYTKVFKDKSGQKPSAEQIQKLAEYALTHGLNDKFVEIMKKLGESNPTNEAVVAFGKVQAALERPVAKGGPADLKAHLSDYKEATLKDDKGHFVLYHKFSSSDQEEVQGRLARLEDSLRTFYYWFALKGVVLPMPATRLPSLLTEKEPEFKRTRNSLADPPIVGDGIFARREDLSIFCAKPLDERYDMLATFTDTKMKQYNFNPQELLKGKENLKGTSRPDAVREAAYAGTLALAMKELEDEAERAGASHEATRQLLFASGLLPRNVTVPEWVQFGMGSFFETPEHSPWPTPTGLSTIYLPAFRYEMGEKGKHFEGSPLKTLRKIVTDDYFRDLAPDDYKNKTDRLMKARAATWSLTYYLAQKKLGGLQRYFKYLSEMPRDLELDDTALLDCFARAFDCYDAKTKKPDEGRLGAFAEEWMGFMHDEPLEAEVFLKKLQEIYAESIAKPEEPKKPAVQPGGMP
jgi:hypothetical protein